MQYINKQVRQTTDYMSHKQLTVDFYHSGIHVELKQEETNNIGEFITTVNSFLPSSEAISLRDTLLLAYPL